MFNIINKTVSKLDIKLNDDIIKRLKTVYVPYLF